ncbi:hypothetical protein ASC99_06550 [Kitasatospora sp. Root107]|nr:hypothetical protein ASC99_06550 [Kitasatospora sp. Root107]
MKVLVTEPSAKRVSARTGRAPDRSAYPRQTTVRSLPRMTATATPPVGETPLNRGRSSWASSGERFGNGGAGRSSVI